MIDNVNDLRTFLRVIDEGSLSAAARALRLSVNGVSRRLAQLEQKVGVQLAQRTTRQFLLTEEGRRFSARCRRIIGEIDDAEADFAPQGGGFRGVVRIAMNQEFMTAEVLGPLSRLMAEHTDLAIQIFARNSPVDPSSENLDLALWPGEVQFQSAIVKRVASSEWVMAATRDYVERHGRPRTLKDLARHECLRVMRRTPETRWTLRDRRGREFSAEIGGRFECDDKAGLVAALYLSLGIGLRPRGEVLREVAAGRLVHILPRWQFAKISVSVISAPGRLKLPRVRAVADALAEAASLLT